MLFWDSRAHELVIHARQPERDPNDDADVDYALNMIDGDVPLEGRVALAQDFVDRFET